jgi:putative endonuclease
MYYTYVLKNPKGILYKGSTEHLGKRISQHNKNIFPGYTHGKGPWTLIYSETFNTRRGAEDRESFFKTGKGRTYLKTILNNSTSQTDSENRRQSAE